MEYEMDFFGNKIMVVMAVDARGSFITDVYHLPFIYDVCKSLALVLRFMWLSFPAVQSSLFFQGKNNKTHFPHRQYSLTTGSVTNSFQIEEKLTRTKKCLNGRHFPCENSC